MFGNLQLRVHQINYAVDGFVGILTVVRYGVTEHVEDEVWGNATTGIGNLKVYDLQLFVNVPFA